MYDRELVEPMITELTSIGFEELTTVDEVETFLQNKENSQLVVINSVCGCAAKSARPALEMALQHSKIPVKLATVFAGVDKEATEQLRSHLLPYPPSSPSIALFKEGKLVHIHERHQIEGRPAELITQELIQLFDEYC